MVRNPRNWSPGATYHITARGNRKQDLFLHIEDREKYLYYLQDTKDKYPFTLHAYCLMTNHIHLLLETHHVPLAQIFRTLHTRYAVFFNKKYDFIGHLFQGRYGSTLVDSTAYFLQLSRYIHQNPVQAKLISRAENYPWSSYPSYFHSIHNPLLSKTKTLSYFPEPQVKFYKEYIEKEEITTKVVKK
ncbi:transposase [Rossellomorea aquimaris]|uniref:transposase n=1 Tax=Rossellomorea aquimaris TaxID=189382 RepID=UPI0007D0A0C2|nr:transposase [Rossellomorea aquimaris]